MLMDQQDNFLTGHLDSFEVVPVGEGLVGFRLVIDGTPVVAAAGAVHASLFAKELRKAATEVHVKTEATKH